MISSIIGWLVPCYFLSNMFMAGYHAGRASEDETIASRLSRSLFLGLFGGIYALACWVINLSVPRESQK